MAARTKRSLSLRQLWEGTGCRGSQGGAPGGARGSQEEPGGARRSPGGQEDPGGDRRSQEESSGTEENPVFQKGEQVILAYSCLSWGGFKQGFS